MERICEYCKAPFIPKRTDALYCSASCRQLAYVSRKATNKQSIEGVKETFSCQQNESIEDVLPSTTADEVSELTVNETDPSINSNELDVYPSTSENLSVNNGVQQPSIQKPEQEKQEYTEYYSTYIGELNLLVDQRDVIGKLAALRFSNGKDYALWLNIRFKCLVECLLTFSDMQEIPINDLKEVCNAFTSLIQSRDFKVLGLHYPYSDEIIQWRDRIKSLCLETEHETTALRLKKEKRQTLLAIRYELANNAPKVPFSKLNFKE